MLGSSVTDNWWKRPITYVPVYPSSINGLSTENFTSRQLKEDLSETRKELAELRAELYHLRLEKSTRQVRSPSPVLPRFKEYADDCSICSSRLYSREKEDKYHRTSSPLHFCSICNDYVIDRTSPPPSPRPHKKETHSKYNTGQDRFSAYSSRHVDFQRLHPRHSAELRPIWISTAYNHDYLY